VPQRAAHDAAGQRRAEPDLGVRHQLIDQREHQPQDHERQELEEKPPMNGVCSMKCFTVWNAPAAGQPERDDNGNGPSVMVVQ
jgi:hypothetical protein